MKLDALGEVSQFLSFPNEVTLESGLNPIKVIVNIPNDYSESDVIAGKLMATPASEFSGVAGFLKTVTIMIDQPTNPTATGMLSDGTMVSIWTSEPTAGQKMEIYVEFEVAELANHDITVTQNGEPVLMHVGVRNQDGAVTYTTKPLMSSDSVDITVTFLGYGIGHPKTGPIGEEVVFSNVVPEFGTIAMMILVVSTLSIIGITAKYRMIPRL